jgi:hypothetical protein
VCGDQTALGLTFIREAKTAPNYRLYEVNRQFTALVAVEAGGVSVSGELCHLSRENYEILLKQEPNGLHQGLVELDNGAKVLCAVSSFATLPSHATDISEHGNFVDYLESLKKQP